MSEETSRTARRGAGKRPNGAGRPTGGRPRVIDRDAVAREVVAHGFAGLSVAAVAGRLGVNQASLYRHVGGVDDLIDVGLSWLIRQTAWPAEGENWREVLEGTAWTVWGILRDNPGLTLAAGNRLFVNDELMVAFNELCLALTRHGFSIGEATLAADFVLDLTFDSMLTHDFLVAGTLGSDPGREPPRAWTANLDPRVLEIITDAAGDGHERWFAGKLGLALDGIEHQRGA